MHRRRTKNDSMNFRFFCCCCDTRCRFHSLTTHTNKNWTLRLIYVFYLQIIRFYWKRNDNWPFREPMETTKKNAKHETHWRTRAGLATIRQSGRDRWGDEEFSLLSFSRIFNIELKWPRVVSCAQCPLHCIAPAIKTIKSDRHGWM